MIIEAITKDRFNQIVCKFFLFVDKNFTKIINKVVKLFIIIIATILVSGCGNKSVIYFYSLDKSQCITVISEYNQRYVIDGKHNHVPDTNFVKLHIKPINSMWNGFYVCWKSEKYKWDVIVPYSEILESKLDTALFNFNTKLPKDERGIPTEIKFSGSNCAIYDFELKRLTPDKGAIVKYK